MSVYKLVTQILHESIINKRDNDVYRQLEQFVVFI